MKIKGRIFSALAVCLTASCITGIAVTANETVKTAYVEDGFVYKDSEMTEVINEFYAGNDGTIYIDPEMTIAVPHLDKSVYGVNENGETFGNCLEVIYVDDEPDLMAAVGDNGIKGYVRKTELDGEKPANPEEAVRMQEEREKNGNPPMVINVYESDGVTVIDTFTSG